MRRIPPEIWALAVALGQMQKVINETQNAHAIKAAGMMAQKIERFLEWSRKEQKK